MQDFFFFLQESLLINDILLNLAESSGKKKNTGREWPQQDGRVDGLRLKPSSQTKEQEPQTGCRRDFPRTWCWGLRTPLGARNPKTLHQKGKRGSVALMASPLAEARRSDTERVLWPTRWVSADSIGPAGPPASSPCRPLAGSSWAQRAAQGFRWPPEGQAADGEGAGPRGCVRCYQRAVRPLVVAHEKRFQPATNCLHRQAKGPILPGGWPGRFA